MENQILLDKLKGAGVDVSQAVSRFMENDALFIKFMHRLPEALKLSEMELALKEGRGDDFYSYIHDLKGVCGNLCISDAFNAAQTAVVEYRASGLKNQEKMQELVSEIQTSCQKVLDVLDEDK